MEKKNRSLQNSTFKKTWKFFFFLHIPSSEPKDKTHAVNEKKKKKKKKKKKSNENTV